MHWPRSKLHVARYYMKRGAYLAAANRAQYAVLNYPDAPATEEALFIMVKAYDALGSERPARRRRARHAQELSRQQYYAWSRSQGTVVEALVVLPSPTTRVATPVVGTDRCGTAGPHRADLQIDCLMASTAMLRRVLSKLNSFSEITISPACSRSA
jgi:hypothetical protein